MYIHQYLLDILQKETTTNKVLVIYGPRQIGKTTLLNKLLESKSNYLLVNGEDIDVQHYLSSQSITQLKSFVGDHKLLVIDEAQKIPKIGLNLKLIVDHIPNIQIIATGSSAFDLSNELGEPLTGRKKTFRLFPLSQIELGHQETVTQTRSRLTERLIYGSYPEAILTKNPNDKQSYLNELVSDYLFRDILEIESIRKSKKLIQILQMLAFQIGQPVSLSEIGQKLALNKSTIDRYIDLLEKCFILISVQGYGRNLRKSITKKSKYYFYDLGVRNAVINQFNPPEIRNDIGQLWENYIITERIKKQSYQKIFANNYYWRTYSQQEIDWIEEIDGQPHAYEIKWKATRASVPHEWRQSYPDATFSLIHSENYLEFIA